MKTEHTQGPWKAHVAHELLNVVADSVVSVDGLHVADIASYGASITTRNANARLIAAAPDLLAALEDIVKLTEITDFWLPKAWLDDAKAAISKTEGNA